MPTRLLTVFAVLGGLVAGCGSAGSQPAARPISLPDAEPFALEPAGRLAFEPIVESSGFVRSRMYPGVFWTHNDSGDVARIFPVTETGEIVRPTWREDFDGVHVLGAVNVDWEDIAADDEGNLIIGACGNNGNARRDLAVYIVPEPNPRERFDTRYAARYLFSFPDQTDYPPEKMNYDCEAVFFADGKVHFLTKHRSDTMTRLYRMDEARIDRVNRLTLLGEFDARGMVTGADTTVDERRLAVLTYGAVWVFERESPGESFLGGKVLWIPIEERGCEAICFADDDRLLLTNEGRDIYEIPVARMRVVRE